CLAADYQGLSEQRSGFLRPPLRPANPGQIHQSASIEPACAKAPVQLCHFTYLLRRAGEFAHLETAVHIAMTGDQLGTLVANTLGRLEGPHGTAQGVARVTEEEAREINHGQVRDLDSPEAKRPS